MEDVINELMQDAQIVSQCVAPPQVVAMPYAHEPGKVYLRVVLFLGESAVRVSIIGRVCSCALRRLHCADLLGEYHSVEILVCRVHNSETQRILTFSVQRSGIERAMQLIPLDLRSQEPFVGSMCVWYVDKGAVAD